MKFNETTIPFVLVGYEICYSQIISNMGLMEKLSLITHWTNTMKNVIGQEHSIKVQ